MTCMLQSVTVTGSLSLPPFFFLTSLGTLIAPTVTVAESLLRVLLGAAGPFKSLQRDEDYFLQDSACLFLSPFSNDWESLKTFFLVLGLVARF